jgi:hypothetical protein
VDSDCEYLGEGAGACGCMETLGIIKGVITELNRGG